jgi:hypothetical protein
VISSWLGGKGNQIRLRNTPQGAKSLLAEFLGMWRGFLIGTRLTLVLTIKIK